MKSLLLLAALALSAPAVRAQEMTTPAQIDPAARDLLARTMARYQKFNSFESVISWETGAGSDIKPRRFRLQVTRAGQFVVGEEFSDKSWRKWISDGVTVIGFNSKFSGRYTRSALKMFPNASRNEQWKAHLDGINVNGPMVSLLGSEAADTETLLSESDSLTVKDQGALKIVKMLSSFIKAGGKIERDAIEIWLDPETLTVNRMKVSDGSHPALTETYAQTRFNPTFDATLFRAAAPVGYKLIQTFEPPSTRQIKPPQIAAIR